MKTGISLQAIRYGFRTFFGSHFKILTLSILAVVGLLAIGSMILMLLVGISTDYHFIYLLRDADDTYVTRQAIEMIKSQEVVNVYLWATVVISMISFFIVRLGFGIGFQKLALDIYDKRPVSIYTIFSCFRLIPKMFFATVLYVVIVLVGIVLLVIPGVYLGARFSLFSFYIIDHDASIINSLRYSWRETKNDFWGVLIPFIFFLFLFIPANFFIVIYIPILGSIYIFIINILSVLVYTYIYRHLAGKGLEAKVV